MKTADHEQLIAAEHAALAADLEGLSGQQWEQTSLCTEWTVHDVHAPQGAAKTNGGVGWMGGVTDQDHKRDHRLDNSQ
jgi:hypothetical protein